MDTGKVAQDIMREVEGLFSATVDTDDVRVATEGVRRVLSALPETGVLTDEQIAEESLKTKFYDTRRAWTGGAIWYRERIAYLSRRPSATSESEPQQEAGLTNEQWVELRRLGNHIRLYSLDSPQDADYRRLVNAVLHRPAPAPEPEPAPQQDDAAVVEDKADLSDLLDRLEPSRMGASIESVKAALFVAYHRGGRGMVPRTEGTYTADQVRAAMQNAQHRDSEIEFVLDSLTAEAILEDGGCIHNQAPVICGVCKPFIAAREAFALHCREEYALIAARREAEWTLIDASMRFTKHHILAYPQDGLSSDDTFVMAYSGGYRTGQDALDDHWMYVKKLDRPINAPQEPA